MRKYKLISALAEETAKEVVRNEESWRRYLNTASRLYKYPFKEQLLIYAQRPDATACASIEIWNEKMHCWVNKGAKGIALIDEDSFSKREITASMCSSRISQRLGNCPIFLALCTSEISKTYFKPEKLMGTPTGKPGLWDVFGRLPDG